jgi:hypothetical protein
LGSSRAARTTLLALVLAFGAGTPSARAGEPDAGTRVAARELAVSGAEAFEKRDYVVALDRFQRAEALYKVPSIAVMVARCLAQLGRVVEAVDKYEETLRMPLDAGAPEAFQRAVADATVEVEVTRERVARLELRPPVDVPSGLQIMLDDKPVPKALWGVAKPVNPGVHHVTALAPGREPYSYDVTLAEGARQAVDITLLAAHPAAASGRPSASEPAAGPERGISPAAIGLLAGGGLALAAGAVTGVVALNHKSTLDDACKPACPEYLSSDLASFRRNRTLSYVGFGVGLVATSLGAYFLIHEGSSGSQVGALILPSGAALKGTF